MVAQVTDLFPSFSPPGFRLVDAGELKQQAELLFGVAAGLTALAGGGQSGATLLTGAINEVSTVATTSDSVMLPPGVPGRQVVAINNGANTMQVYGQLTETIAANNATTQAASTTGVAQATTTVGIYFCFSTGKWKQLLS